MNLHVHHAFLYISLLSLHDYDVNCLISRFIDVDSAGRVTLLPGSGFHIYRVQIDDVNRELLK